MSNAPQTAVPRVEEPWTAFAAWAADELSMRLVCEEGAYRAEPVVYESDTKPPAGARKSWLLRRRPPEEGQGAPPLQADSPAGLTALLIERLSQHDRVAHLRPIDQPMAVYEIAGKLLSAYQLDAGKCHVAGCALEDAPFVRVSVLTRDDSQKPTVAHTFYGERGEPVDPRQIELLGLDRVAPYGDPAPRLADGLLATLIGSAKETWTQKGGDSTAPDAVVASIVWARRAVGRLSFEFGEESVEAPFDGWARTLEAPQVVCPQTGVETYHLATVEGGAIAAAEEIAKSEVSGLRRLKRDLTRCGATGKRGEREWFGECEVSGEPVLLDHLEVCPRCGLKVTKGLRSAHGCAGCDQAKPVAANDERLRATLGRHPTLSKRKWRLSETPGAYVLVCDGWLNQRVAVVSKESLDLRRHAKRSRLSSTWRAIGPG